MPGRRATIVRMEHPTFLTGQILLAMPGIGDPGFERAAIAMCMHDESGAMGIGLSQTVPGMGLHTLLDQIGIEPGAAPDVPLHIGGPVDPQRGFVVHSDDWGGEDTIDVAGLWRLSGTIDVLRAIADGRGPSRFVIALGYAGWGAGQIEAELARPGWFAAPVPVDILYDRPAAGRWAASFAHAGVDSRLLTAGSGHA